MKNIHWNIYFNTTWRNCYITTTNGWSERSRIRLSRPHTTFGSTHSLRGLSTHAKHVQIVYPFWIRQNLLDLCTSNWDKVSTHWSSLFWPTLLTSSTTYRWSILRVPGHRHNTNKLRHHQSLMHSSDWPNYTDTLCRSKSPARVITYTEDKHTHIRIHSEQAHIYTDTHRRTWADIHRENTQIKRERTNTHAHTHTQPHIHT